MKLVAIPSQEAPSATSTLRDAIEDEFDSVIVFGFKNGQIFITSSDIEDNLRLIGALDAARQQIWANA